MATVATRQPAKTEEQQSAEAVLQYDTGDRARGRWERSGRVRGSGGSERRTSSHSVEKSCASRAESPSSSKDPSSAHGSAREGCTSLHRSIHEPFGRHRGRRHTRERGAHQWLGHVPHRRRRSQSRLGVRHAARQLAILHAPVGSSCKPRGRTTEARGGAHAKRTGAARRAFLQPQLRFERAERLERVAHGGHSQPLHERTRPQCLGRDRSPRRPPPTRTPTRLL